MPIMEPVSKPGVAVKVGTGVAVGRGVAVAVGNAVAVGRAVAVGVGGGNVAVGRGKATGIRRTAKMQAKMENAINNNRDAAPQPNNFF